jgi:hypothetical protein
MINFRNLTEMELNMVSKPPPCLRPSWRPPSLTAPPAATPIRPQVRPTLSSGLDALAQIGGSAEGSGGGGGGGGGVAAGSSTAESFDAAVRRRLGPRARLPRARLTGADRAQGPSVRQLRKSRRTS